MGNFIRVAYRSETLVLEQRRTLCLMVVSYSGAQNIIRPVVDRKQRYGEISHSVEASFYSVGGSDFMVRLLNVIFCDFIIFFFPTVKI